MYDNVLRTQVTVNVSVSVVSRPHFLKQDLTLSFYGTCVLSSFSQSNELCAVALKKTPVQGVFFNWLHPKKHKL